jgi:hypothetical protein
MAKTKKEEVKLTANQQLVKDAKRLQQIGAMTKVLYRECDEIEDRLIGLLQEKGGVLNVTAENPKSGATESVVLVLKDNFAKDGQPTNKAFKQTAHKRFELVVTAAKA